MNKYSYALLALLCPFLVQAQTNALDTTLRAHQKYYVVAAVLTLIFAGIVLFLISVEKRLKKLENGN